MHDSIDKAPPMVATQSLRRYVSCANSFITGWGRGGGGVGWEDDKTKWRGKGGGGGGGGRLFMVLNDILILAGICSVPIA